MLSELFYSIEDVWIAWLISCSILSWLLYRSIGSQNWAGVRSFFRDERGASYALNYLMTFPFYLIVVCWVIQSTMIIMVKIGVMHSAHVAARSAVVWRPAHPDSHSKGLDEAKKKARHAAAFVLTPYASGYDAHQNVFQYDPGARLRSIQAIPHAIAYDKLYRQLAKNSEAKDCLAQADFLRRKYRYAAAMTTVKFDQHNNRFNQKLSVEVKFRMPIHIPGTGWVLGKLHWSRKGFYRDVRAIATLPLETAETPDGRLGIAYDSSRL